MTGPGSIVGCGQSNSDLSLCLASNDIMVITTGPSPREIVQELDPN